MYSQTQMIMTIFQGHTNIMTILLFIFLVFLGAPATAARHDVMEELFTHDELRREAGYGDEKLSNVVVSGSVLCDVCLDGTSVRQSHPIPGMHL